MVKNYILAALSGLMLALAFPHPSIGFLAWIGLVPLFLALKNANLKNAPLLGLVFGLVFFSVVLYWIQLFGYIAWISLSTFLSIWPVIFATGFWLIIRNYGVTSQLILVPSLWALSEYARSLGPFGFAWANIGSAVDSAYLLKFASYTGESGLGFVIITVNVILFQLFTGEGLRQRYIRGVQGISVLAVFVLLWPLLAWIVHSPQADNNPRAISMAVIQPNIAQELKASAANNEEIQTRYLKMTKQALDLKPDLIIWPESAFVSHIEHEKAFLTEIYKLLLPSRTSLILGSHDEISGDLYNGAFYIDYPRKKQVYHKIRLVPFGEYVPVRGLVERINGMAALVTNLKPGSNYKVFDIDIHTPRGDIEGGRLSVLICFESIDSALARKMVNSGARMLVVITNDGWFGKTAALEQHFKITRMRAVEYGVPVVQAANTGISGIIDKNGKIGLRTGADESVILGTSVEFASETSFFAGYGHLLPLFYLLTIAIAITYRIVSYGRAKTPGDLAETVL